MQSSTQEYRASAGPARVRSYAAFCWAILFLALSPGTIQAQIQPAAGQIDTTGGTTHVVRKGDTLWDLSALYLQSPWLWPSVYEANNQIIADPHWIYPGQRIWFPIGGGIPVILSFEEVWPESRLGVSEAAREVELAIPEEERPVVAPVREAVTEQQVTVTEQQVTATEQQEEVESGGLDLGLITPEERYHPLASVSAILAAGYIGDPRQWPRGQIIGGESDEMNMSVYNQVFLDVGDRDAEVGDFYVVVEQGPRVRHPEWGHRLGRKINVKGILRIVDVEGRTSQGVMAAVFDAVKRKDRVIPAPEVDSRPWKEFVGVQGGRSGYVVARAKPEGNLHPYDMLFIDGGSEEGVRVGDLYVIRRPQTERGRLRFYEEELGRAVVIAVQEKTATVMLLTISTSDIAAGEKVELIGRSVFVDSAGSER